LWQHSFVPVAWGLGLLLVETVAAFLLSYVLPEMKFEEWFRIE
jgi:hypothetical protein